MTEESSEGRDTDEQEDAEEVLSWTEDSSELLSPTLWADKEYGVPESVEVVAEPEYTPESNSNVWFKEKVFTTSRVNQTAELAEVAQAAEQHQHEQVSADLGPEDAIPVNAEVQFETTEDVQEELEAVASVQVEEKKELKIAVGSKKGSDEEQENSFGITKLLPSKRIGSEVEALVEEEEVLAESSTEPRDNEEVYWKNLFIGNVDEKTPFRKVKLVIVQREETLDDIAQRYHLSNRELQLYNRLSEQNISEGQVLYIP